MAIQGIRKLYQTPVTQIDATALYLVGEEREEFDATYGLKRYRYMQADDTIAINSPLTEDIAASATGAKVTPVATAGIGVCGVAEVAVTDEYYFWGTIRGKGVVLAGSATNIAVGDPLAASASGTVVKAVEADSAGAYKNVNIYALAANVSGSAAATLCKINCA